MAHLAQPRVSLGRKFVAYIILTSAFFTLVASGLQLLEMFRRDREAVMNELSIVQSSFQEGLEEALWKFNFDQVDLLLNGILAQPDVVFIELKSPTGHEWILGREGATPSRFQDFELMHEYPNGSPAIVGALRVGVTFDEVWFNLKRQVVAIALTNFARTLAVAFLILFIFDRLAARHLRFIANYVAKQPWQKKDEKLRLPNKTGGADDEIGQIVAALNLARREASIAYDKTVEKNLKLDQLNKELKEANREQAEFTYAISHDLKSPVNTLDMLFGEFQEAHVLDDKGLQTELIDDISKTLTRMRELIDGVLRYSQVVECVDLKETVDLDMVVQDVMADMEADIKASGAMIQLDSLGAVPGNKVQLRMLLQNLLSNAIKFSRPGISPVVKVSKIEAPTKPNNLENVLRFVVLDNGIGVEEIHKERIFGLFKRLQTRNETSGDGIGLAVCRRIANNHQGTVRLVDWDNLGAAFQVTLRKG